ncbi:MAG: putative Zn-dependent protease [Planctomycetota bacterium]|jgi:predicted Zn-dependent protease
MYLVMILSIGLFSIEPGFAFGLDDLKKLQEKIEKSKDSAEKSKVKIDQVRGKVSQKEEIEIGGNLISGLLGAAALVDDAPLQQYINDVGYWVASQSKRKSLPWRFGVIQSDGINAFAAPGGYIVITLGLFQVLQNEAQLAAVLAHEIAHVADKHHLKALQKTMKREFWSDIALSAVGDATNREKLEKMVNAGVQLYATGLDRNLEYEADLVAVVLAARAGYDPFALLDVLTTIDSINPGSAEMAVILKTHPPTLERLNQLAGKMDGKLDAFANGRQNTKRFIAVTNQP